MAYLVYKPESEDDLTPFEMFHELVKKHGVKHDVRGATCLLEGAVFNFETLSGKLFFHPHDSHRDIIHKTSESFIEAVLEARK